AASGADPGDAALLAPLRLRGVGGDLAQSARWLDMNALWRNPSESWMTEIVTSSSMRRQGKPIHGTSSEAPSNRKNRATGRMFLPTRRLCLTLHADDGGDDARPW